ncbi:glycosyltransferase [Defluviicoccus vanus]|uniref:Glycosyltransferase family 2 protein n=1 Tax=Defluviicoccus vanus TaxID=111831 RepID=A0A7H1N350_9PROT|nr:glycosyltransferase family 2 protein [Defluviicoccus vanus]QNT70136.1 glycosyltransferase family 2 protein [Defluviicoccus vanus]
MSTALRPAAKDRTNRENAVDDRPPHICVCVPTYRRPLLLGSCLCGLKAQDAKGFSYSIVVADNDVLQSARNVVDDARRQSSVEIFYCVNSIPNISRARNTALKHARGDLIAFIDDDETPHPLWLTGLYATYVQCAVDGVLGPVAPDYEGTPPRWLVESRLCERTSLPTGTPLSNVRDMRTGNLLFARAIVLGDEEPFDPRYGRTGGEDTAFFQKKLEEGRRFVWCEEAIVFETVPRERQTLRYFVRRAVLLGATAATRERRLGLSTIKSVAAANLYAVALPFALLLGYHHFVKVLVKDCNHLGKLLAHLGVKVVRERSST